MTHPDDHLLPYQKLFSTFIFDSTFMSSYPLMNVVKLDEVFFNASITEGGIWLFTECGEQESMW